MSVEENISIMRRWYSEVWRDRNNETIHELLTSDARLRGQNGPEQEIKGPEGFLEFAERIRNAFPDTEVAVEDIFAADDKVAVRWVATGTHTSPLGLHRGIESQRCDFSSDENRPFRSLRGLSVIGFIDN